MSWSWDSTQIDFSQTCWTFDGSNTCDAGGGISVLKPNQQLLRDEKDIMDIISMIARQLL